MRLCTLCNKRSRTSSRLMPTSLPSACRSESFRYPADQARSDQLSPFSAQAWLVALPKQPPGSGRVEADHCASKLRQVVCIDPNRARRRASPATRRAVGIDLGITRFATLSDGTFYAPLNSFKRHETALRKAQQAMSRKCSSNEEVESPCSASMPGSAMGGGTPCTRPRPRSAKTTRWCVSLKVRNMSKSAVGSTEQPGTHVRAKSGLNPSSIKAGSSPPPAGLQAPVVRRLAHRCGRSCPWCGHVSTGRRKLGSSVGYVAPRKTPI